MIVPVLHPVPVTYVPRRGRAPRTDLVARVTQVEIAEVSGAETTDVGDLKPPEGNELLQTTLAVKSYAGRAWIPLAAPVPDDEALVREVGFSTYPDPGAPEALEAYLSGASAGTVLYGVAADHFSRTPVSAGYAARRAGTGSDPARGMPESRLDGADVVEDGLAAARPALAAHLAEAIIMIDGRAWTRFRPLLHPRHLGPVGFDVGVGRLAWSQHLEQAYDPEDHAEAAERWHSLDSSRRRPAAEWIASLRGGDPARDALLHNLNRLPDVAAQGLRRLAAADVAERGGLRDETRTLLSACEDLERRARLGGLGLDDAAPAARTLVDALRFLRNHDQFHRRRDELGRADTYLQRFALPRLHALSEPDRDDVDALGALAP